MEELKKLVLNSGRARLTRVLFHFVKERTEFNEECREPFSILNEDGESIDQKKNSKWCDPQRSNSQFK